MSPRIWFRGRFGFLSIGPIVFYLRNTIFRVMLRFPKSSL
jgi:hypothetical protein